jgi:hypothetical protein
MNSSLSSSLKTSRLLSSFLGSVLWVCLLGLPSLLWAAGASVDIKLSPAGGFVGKTEDVKGTVKKVGTKFVGENIVVNLKTLKTGMGLRDKHTQEHLGTAQHPEAILVKAEGENGKGKGIIKIRGIEKAIEGTYKIQGQELVATFPLKLSEFKIENIRYMGVGVKDDVVVSVTVPVQ